ncbi:unnamed protein product [Phaeothamnion confervicola]
MGGMLALLSATMTFLLKLSLSLSLFQGRGGRETKRRLGLQASLRHCPPLHCQEHGGVMFGPLHSVAVFLRDLCTNREESPFVQNTTIIAPLAGSVVFLPVHLRHCTTALNRRHQQQQQQQLRRNDGSNPSG